MRGEVCEQGSMFSYVSLEARIPKDHPLRPMRAMVDRALESLSKDFSRIDSVTGRPSIPPEELLRALLIQILYSVRSERQRVEQLEYNLLFRWFVGLGLIDGRTTRPAGHAISQRRRKRIEEVSGWRKTIGLLRKVRHRGREKIDWTFTFTAAAHDLVQLRSLAFGS